MLHFAAMWQTAAEGQSDRMASDMEVHMKQKCVTEFLHMEKMAYLSTLAKCLWRPNCGCERSEAVGGAFQQWWQQDWDTSTGAGCYECGMQALVHCWWRCTADGVTVEKECFVAENLLYK